ncbi:hypothetical protein WAK64_12740 [Bacillus spongiae]|uniref:Fur-regulated basic protein FbpA n=1 Tax=Bacillus spongiae TaxID=2683610 RepID=A0ABU8HEV9_9BACI
MDHNRKARLERLLKKYKVKQAKRQLIDDLVKYHEIDFSEKEFVDDELSEDVYKRVYDRIREDIINTIKFPYDEL